MENQPHRHLSAIFLFHLSSEELQPTHLVLSSSILSLQQPNVVNEAERENDLASGHPLCFITAVGRKTGFFWSEFDIVTSTFYV